MSKTLISKVKIVVESADAVVRGKSVEERRSFAALLIRRNGRINEMMAKATEDERHEIDLIVESFALGRPFGSSRK